MATRYNGVSVALSIVWIVHEAFGSHGVGADVASRRVCRRKDQ
jgi:hypothetical protein